MANPSNHEIESVIEKLSRDDFQMSDQELVTLLWITSQDGPDTLEKAQFALQLTLDIEQMVQHMRRSISNESRRNPTFNARLLPLYKQYEASFQSFGLDLFYRVCKTLLQDSWIYMDHTQPEDPPLESSELQPNCSCDDIEF
jgi:hypothetical protein